MVRFKAPMTVLQLYKTACFVTPNAEGQVLNRTRRQWLIIYGNVGPYQAGGKGTAGARAIGAGGRRGTNRTEQQRNFNSSSSQNANVSQANNTWTTDSDNTSSATQQPALNY